MWALHDNLEMNEPSQDFAGRIPRDIQRLLGLEPDGNDDTDDGDDADEDDETKVFYVR